MTHTITPHPQALLAHSTQGTTYKLILEIAERVSAAGGNLYLVGGSVRDMLLGLLPNDFDLEVHNLDLLTVKQVIETLCQVKERGIHFGVLALSQNTGHEIEISLPRRDSKTGVKHQDFRIGIDPHMGFAAAAKRRDFTINAIGFEVLTGQVIDPFDGITDLHNGILRVVNTSTFPDDSLRVMRAMQLVSRFELSLNQGSFQIMQSMLPELPHLPQSRVRQEFLKLLLSEKPSLGLQLGLELGVYPRIGMPILPRLAETPQDPTWHPEGSVWAHTLMVVDEAARIWRREKLDPYKSLSLMLSALCHDLGKPDTVQVIDGRMRNRGHETAGVPLAADLMSTLGLRNNQVRTNVLKLVADHMTPGSLYRSLPVSDGALRKLAKRLAPATIEDLLLLVEADTFGRGPFPEKKIECLSGQWLRAEAERLGIHNRSPKNALDGEEIMALGVSAGPKVGLLLAEANQLRDEQGMSHAELLTWAKSKVHRM